MLNNPSLTYFNESLQNLREVFYSEGRIGDSNVKLDELCKLLCIEIASGNDPNIPSLDDIVQQSIIGENIIRLINITLLRAAQSNKLKNYNGESLLGVNPQLELSSDDGSLCIKLCKSISAILKHKKNENQRHSFDFINEAFGHFIRDSFRQNIEDAQYMTPIEVVDFIVKLAISRVDEKFENQKKGPVVCDPSCGVGSFLTHFYQEWVIKNNLVPPTLVGQDKVDRMARLTLINAYLSGINEIQITRCNSLSLQSPLNKFKNSCDIIVTNPPFGAKINQSKNNPQCAFLDSGLENHIVENSFFKNSELCFLELYLELLKPGGSLFAILPDSVCSSSGAPELLRRRLEEQDIESIIELPSITFAQAGTRTKTCILELKKIAPSNKSVFIAKAEHIGYDVSSKKGVSYRKETGINELPEILNFAKEIRGIPSSEDSPHVLNKEPSCVEIHKNYLRDYGWTPSYYAAERFLTLEKIASSNFTKEFDIIELSDIALIASKGRRGIKNNGVSKCISVLHIGDFGSLNVKELLEYAPKTPGKPCCAGDILFSKINPRIPRALVVPNLPYELTCSSEFEVLRPKSTYCPYEIMLLLLSKYAQNQILALTSGTSSSHNRIKTQQLMTIKIALPKKTSQYRLAYEKCIEDFKQANIQLNTANICVEKAWSDINRLMN